MSGKNKLPEGWTLAELQDITLPRETRNPKKSGEGSFKYVDIDALDNKIQRIVSPKSIENDEAPSRARMSINQNDVIFSLVRPYLKNIAIVPAELNGEIASTAYCVLKPSVTLNSKYLFFYVTQEEFINSVQTYGNSPPSARDDEFLSLKIPVAPSNEQRRIVAKIEELFSHLDKGVEALERVKANLKRYRASVLKAAVEGRLTEQWRRENPDVEPASDLLKRILPERRKKWEEEQLAKYKAKGKKPPEGWKEKYKEPIQPDTSNLPKLPKGWCWVTLSQVGFLDRGKSKHRPRNAPHLFGGRYPFIQTGDIKKAGTFITEFSQTYNEEGLRQSKLWPNGTLCITIAANIAQTAILGIDACFPDSVVGFTPINSEVSVRYVELFMRTMQSRIESIAPATAQKNINLKTLRDLPVCLPPVAEQVEVAHKVDELLSIELFADKQVVDGLIRSSRLRQSILIRAFEGKLVPQDPNDEPASALLDRMRYELKGQKMKKTHRGQQTKVGKFMNKMKDQNERMPLFDTLVDSGGRATPEELLRNSGHDYESIDQFYEDLRTEIDSGRIIEIRPDETSVFLKVKSHED